MTAPAPMARWTRRAALFALAGLAAAMPWETLQRIHLGGFTAVDLAGGLLIVSTALGAYSGAIRPRPLGLEPALFAVAIAFALSTVFSIDRALSLGFVKTYVLYGALAYSVAYWCGDARTLRRAGWIFTWSSAGVAVLGVACAAGAALPTHLAVSGWAHVRVVDAWENGAMVRVAAASADFNQGALPLLLALAFSVFAPGESAWIRRVRIPLAALLFGGILVTLSRSNLFAAAAILALAAASHAPRGVRRRVTLAFVAAAFAVAVSFVSWDYATELWRRLTSGIVSRNPSAEVRLAGLYAALETLPRFVWTGCGLGNSDAVLHASSHGPAMHKTSLHSVPLKLLLETGALGLAAYLWSWRRLLGFCHNGSGGGTDWSVAAPLAGLFAILLVQPFMTLPLVPFWAGLALGKRAAPPEDSERTDAGARRMAQIASALIGVLVVTNIGFYQSAALRWRDYADTMEEAIAQYAFGDFERAAALFRKAAAKADREAAGAAIDAFPYADVAAKMLQTDFVYRELGIGYASPNPLAAAWFGEGHARTRIESSSGFERYTMTISRMTDCAAAHFALADALWENGRYAEALNAYEAGRLAEPAPANAAFRAGLGLLDARIAELNGATDIASRLVLADLLRRRGRIDEAAAIWKAAAGAPEAAHIAGIVEAAVSGRI